ncbi:MAG: hypothetical protein C0459_12355 [Chitinophaga sp.]|nr:hypothetical protein [Chitinophaga sp.]
MKPTNTLFPVFLKLENLRLLIVGGGFVAEEKLTAVLNNSPETKITIVAIEVSEAVKNLAAQFPDSIIKQKKFEATDLDAVDIVIAAVNDIAVATEIREAANVKGILINAADKPELCDFYLGSVVNKGSLKIAISTNGKSPTIAKRIKETLNETLPDELEEVLDNMQTIRKSLNGDFTDKVNKLNDITKVLAAKQEILPADKQDKTIKWQEVVKFILFAFAFMIIGHTLFSYIPFSTILNGIKSIPQYIDTKSFLLMLLTGFLAQMADGSLGMGYGTISTTFLLAIGINPAVVSSRVHSARVFSSGVSGYSHHRFGNINKKLFRALVIPGVIGAVIGAALATVAKEYSTIVRIPLSVYTIYLGYYIIKKAFKKKLIQDKVKGAGWLASAGGFMDAFAGGGWGALVTSTLISKRKSPRYVIGSVCLAEFFVVLSSSVTFFILLKHIPLFDVAGLILGGVIAAPIAARLAGKLPMKKMLIAVGVLVILTSTNTLVKAVLTYLHH